MAVAGFLYPIFYLPVSGPPAYIIVTGIIIVLLVFISVTIASQYWNQLSSSNCELLSLILPFWQSLTEAGLGEPEWRAHLSACRACYTHERAFARFVLINSVLVNLLCAVWNFSLLSHAAISHGNPSVSVAVGSTSVIPYSPGLCQSVLNS